MEINGTKKGSKEFTVAKEDHDRAISWGLVERKYFEHEGDCMCFSKQFGPLVEKYQPQKSSEMVDPVLDHLRINKGWTRSQMVELARREKTKHDLQYLCEFLFRVLELIQRQGLNYPQEWDMGK